MKEYKKPAMLALSISANDRLCGGCQLGTRNNPYFIDLDGTFGDKNGVFTRDEAAAIGMFGSTENECFNPYEGYCKFTATQDEGLPSVFTS